MCVYLSLNNVYNLWLLFCWCFWITLIDLVPFAKTEQIVFFPGLLKWLKTFFLLKFGLCLLQLSSILQEWLLRWLMKSVLVLLRFYDLIIQCWQRPRSYVCDNFNFDQDYLKLKSCRIKKLFLSSILWYQKEFCKTPIRKKIEGERELN